MGNARDLRKKIARLVEDEIVTINVEIYDFEERVKEVDWKELKKVSYTRLSSLRRQLQKIKSDISDANKSINNIDKGDGFGDQIITVEDHTDTTNKVVIDNWMVKKLTEDEN